MHLMKNAKDDVVKSDADYERENKVVVMDDVELALFKKYADPS